MFRLYIYFQGDYLPKALVTAALSEERVSSFRNWGNNEITKLNNFIDKFLYMRTFLIIWIRLSINKVVKLLFTFHSQEK